MLRQIGLATLQWNCTEIFLIISEQQRSSGCLATQAGKAHFLPHSPPSPPCPSLFQLLSQLCVYIKSMKCNNVMSNCAKVIKDTMRSYAKKQHAIWPGITRDNSGANPGKTMGKLLVAAAIMAAVTGRGSGSGWGQNKSCQRQRQQQRQLKQRPAWGSTTHGGVACGRTCNVAAKS